METITELPSRCTHPLEDIELLCTQVEKNHVFDATHKAVVRCMKCGAVYILPCIYRTPWGMCDFSNIPTMERKGI